MHLLFHSTLETQGTENDSKSWWQAWQSLQVVGQADISEDRQGWSKTLKIILILWTGTFDFLLRPNETFPSITAETAFPRATNTREGSRMEKRFFQQQISSAQFNFCHVLCIYHTNKPETQVGKTT